MPPSKDFEKAVEGKGFLEVLFHLKDAPRSFTELVEKLPYSRATVSSRLQEALKLKLVEPTWVLKGRMKVRWQYKLSAEGKRLLSNLEGEEFLKAQETIRRVRERAMEVALEKKATSS